MSSEVQGKMLEELKKIREAVEPKPAPPPPPPAPPKGFREEFMEFLNKYGVVGLAIAFIIGGAAGRLVTALVADFLMPILGLVVPQGDWRNATFWIFKVGDFVGALIDFVIIALIVFVLMKQLSKTGLK